jgi:hypothetical protein
MKTNNTENGSHSAQAPDFTCKQTSLEFLEYRSFIRYISSLYELTSYKKRPESNGVRFLLAPRPV